MRNSINFSICLLLALAAYATQSRAQDTLAHTTPYRFQPYAGLGLLFGSSSNASETENVGYALEIGTRYWILYLGVEYGRSGSKIPVNTGISVDNLQGTIPEDYSTDQALLYGFHAGVTFLNSTLSVGAAVIASSQPIAHSYRTTFPSYATTITTVHSVSFGPDIRFQLGDHLLLNFEYTYHLGSKFGVDYIL
jgi:hypothetical protein